MKLETVTAWNDEGNERVQFGWQITQSRRQGTRVKSTEYTLARVKYTENYDKICELENEYFSLKKKLDYSEEMDIEKAAILYLLLIIPGILYVHHCKKVDKQKKKKNEELKKRMAEILEEVKQYVKTEED